MNIERGDAGKSFPGLQELLAFGGESVFLEAAVGFVGDGAFDEFGRKQAIDHAIDLSSDGLPPQIAGYFRFQLGPVGQQTDDLVRK